MGSLRAEAPVVNGSHTDTKTTTSALIEPVDATRAIHVEGLSTNNDEWVYPHPTDFKISEHPIDEVRSLKVCCRCILRQSAVLIFRSL